MNSVNIIVIGYYGHYNLGDDQYLSSFINLFKFIKYNSIKFVDCDKLINTPINDDDIIILGGGDVLNDYFIDTMTLKFKNKPNKIIAVSVGLPYDNILKNTTKLNIFEHIFIRTKQDIELFKKYYKNISYIPDISYNIEHKKSNYNNLREIKTKKKIIGFALSRHIHNIKYIDEYNNCISNIYTFIKKLINLGYHIVFIPFNTHHLSSTENDILIYNDIISLETTNQCENITFIKNSLNMEELFEIYDIIDYCIPMRYHACLFSIYTNTPFLPIYTTRKINNLLLDINWLHSYKLECNNDDIPVSIDVDKLLYKFNNLVSYSKLIYDFKNEYDIAKKEFETIFTKIVSTKIPTNKIKLTFDAVQKISINNNYSDFRLIKDNKLKDLVVKIVSYYLTDGTINSKYNYGLSEKMFDINFNYNDDWAWIIDDWKKPIQYNNSNGLFNLNYIDQNDYSGAHRSGWQYVFNNLKNLHNENAIILDMSIDKTFHWDLEINTALNIIPYTKPWVGFVHHTFDTTFSSYNCKNLLESSEFKKSLKYCKGIFVLSNYLKNEFIKNGINNVYSLVHPTTVDVIKFKFSNFIKNENKKIVYIGGWLRNTYSYYNVTIPEMHHNYFCGTKIYNIEKAALKGKNMNNYYPENCIQNKLLSALSNTNNHPLNITSQNYSHGSLLTLENTWNKHFYNDIINKINKINIINFLDNDDFDKLLSENIIYINLVDASAVNTLIECIVRNTPILINKIPPVVELLGNDYPLYYKNEIDVYNLLSNSKNIKKAYYHIKRLPKDKYYIETFISDITKIIKKINYI
jgi:polysaccharide pyruvyl transferase WcaK-like protein